MLHSLSEMLGYEVAASDGEIGHVKDAYFDDRFWSLRYFVVETGKWIFGRKVLLAPECAAKPSPARKDLPVMLTRDAIKDGPDVSTDLPVSRQDEMRVREYYSWPRYWEFVAPVGTVGGMVAPPLERSRPQPHPEHIYQGDPNLRSFKEIRGYALEGTDGDIGRVSDLVVDDEGWCVPFLAIEATGRTEQVLIPTLGVKSISADGKSISAWIDRAAVNDSPRYEPAVPVSPAREQQYMDYYQLTRAPADPQAQAARGR